MMCTNECDLKICGLTVVLQPAPSQNAVLLTEWLSDFEFLPVWVPLPKIKGVIKAMVVLQDAANYAALMQKIVRRIAHRETTVIWMGKCYEVAGIQSHTDSLYILELPFFPSAPLPPTLGRAIHAQCFEWLGKADAVLTESLHAKDIFPITLAVKPTGVPAQMCLRISVLRGDLLAPLLWGMSADIGEKITFTGISCRLGKAVQIRASNTFEELLKVPAQNILDLEFVSPTSFKQRHTIQPFPVPDLVFGSLWRRWNAFAPLSCHFPEIEWQAYTAGYDLQTYAMKMKGGPEIGCKGIIRYEVPDSEQAKIATILAHFARYSGVGRKTAMGMGQTHLKIL